MKGRNIAIGILAIALIAIVGGGAFFLMTQEEAPGLAITEKEEGKLKPGTGSICTSDTTVEGVLNFKQAGAAGTDITADLNAKVYLMDPTTGEIGAYLGEYILSTDNTIPFNAYDHFKIFVHDSATSYYTQVFTSTDQTFEDEYGEEGVPCQPKFYLNGLIKKHGGIAFTIYNEDGDAVSGGSNVPSISYDDSYSWKIKFDSNTQDAYAGSEECPSVFIADFNNKWYRLRIEFNQGTTDVDFYIYDSDNTLLEQPPTQTPPTAGNLISVYYKAYDSVAAITTTDLDDTSLSDMAEPAIELLGDFNRFGFIKGGTDHNVWFSVSDSDNNAQDFLVDFNICLEPSVGSGCGGTVVFADLNLSVDFNSPAQDTNNLGLGFDVNFYWLYTVPSLDANYYACINLKNKIDNIDVEDCSSLSFLIDSTKSSTSWDKDTNSWYTSNQTMTLTCSDNNSGCSSTKYKYKTLPTGSFVSWQTYSSPVAFDTDAQYHVDFNSTDNAGNVGDKNTMFLFLDKTNPTVSSDIIENDWNTMSPALDVNLHMTAYDVTSGLDGNWFRIDDDNTSANAWGAWQNFDANIMIDWNTYGDGNFGVQYFVSDLAGLDSNSDINGYTAYVLLDQNGPEWPESISPTTGNYTTSVTIGCAKQIWVRDINYVIDFNTSTLDWNYIYNGTSNTYNFGIDYMSTNTKVWFRCKHIDADQNSGYYTSPTNVVAQADTGFDSISNATPAAVTTIYSASAAFGVDATDSSGTSFCTFEVYKNTVLDNDFNGTAPAADNNNGTWSYTYTSLVNGDTTYAYIYCQDTAGNTSAKISTAIYSVSISAVAPVQVTGGGDGGTSEPFTVISPSTVTGFAQVMTPGQSIQLEIKVKNKSTDPINIIVSVGEKLGEFVSVKRTISFAEGDTRTILVDVNIPADFEVEESFEEIEGTITLKSASETETVPVKITIYPGVSFEGIITGLISIIGYLGQGGQFLKENIAVPIALAIILSILLYASFKIKANTAIKSTVAGIAIIGFVGLGAVFLL